MASEAVQLKLTTARGSGCPQLQRPAATGHHEGLSPPLESQRLTAQQMRLTQPPAANRRALVMRAQRGVRDDGVGI